MRRLMRLFFLSFSGLVACKTLSPLKGKHSSETPSFGIDPQDVDAAKAASCREEKKIWDLEKRKCVAPKDHCLAKKNGSVWQDNRCLSLEHQCLLEKGARWQDGQCHGAKQVCEAKGEGWVWLDKQCLSAQEACGRRGYRYYWSDTATCALKGFMDYCQAEQKPEAVSKTLDALRQLAAWQQGSSELYSCRQTYDWLKATHELRLADQHDKLQLSDLSPLGEFTHLTKLELTNNRLTDLFPLSTLVNLEYLDLQNNLVSDLSDLAALSKLKYLFLGYNRIYDITPLANLTSLEYLSLFDNRVSDVSPLQGLDKLESLHLKGTPLQSIAPLAPLFKLKELNLQLTPLVRKDVAIDEEHCPTKNNISMLVKQICQTLKNSENE